MSSRMSSSLLVAGLAFGQATLDVEWRAPIGELEERVDHRGCVCPDGTTVVTFSNGAYSLVDREGRLIAHRIRRHDLAGSLASTCDKEGRVYLRSDPATVHVLRISGAELVSERTFQMPGLPFRFVLVGDTLWVLGAANLRPSGRPAYVRLFRTTGEFVRAPDLPLPRLAGKSPVAVFANGALLFHPMRQQVIYIPANPFRFFCFDFDGRLVEARDAVGTRHENADFRGVTAQAVHWSAVDWVRNAVCLPDGRVAVQVIKGNRPGGNVSFLELYDSALNLIQRDIPIPFDLGYMLGADHQGDLRFGNFRVMGASIVKVRLR